MSLALTSQIIGFISFGITLLTLLGVYRDLISTIRTAGSTIPIALGNLREEIEAEKYFVRRRLREGDQFGVFPAVASRRSSKRYHAATQLLDATMKDIWQDFKNLERPFLIKNPVRAAEVRKGDYWGESDIDEKPYAKPSVDLNRRQSRKTRDGMEMAEAGISQEPRKSYRTDWPHRLIWWQSKSDVESLADQVQRIQIRRIERDGFEANELVKRLQGQRGRSGVSSSSSSASRRSFRPRPGGSDGGGGGIDKKKRSLAGSRAGSVRIPSRKASPSTRVSRREYREDEEVVIRQQAADPPTSRPSEGEPSNTGRRRERGNPPRVEYEVINPGRIYVDVGDSGRASRPDRGYDVPGWERERRRSYSRDQGR